MMKTIFTTIAIILLPMISSAQMRVPTIPKEDLAVTNRQANEVFDALKAVSHDAKKVVFPIYAHRNRIAYGISIGNDRLLAKASEVAIQAYLVTMNRKNEAVPLTVVGAYSDHDLVVLKAPGLGAPATQWSESSKLKEGAFLSAIRPDGEVQAMGVLSVHERSLRVTDQGFLGIQMLARNDEEGVTVSEVFRGSAAHEVGVKPGDVLLKINGIIVKGIYEASTKLRRLKAGEKPELLIVRDGKPRLVFPTLQPRRIQERESFRMRAMDGEINQVRGNFGNVLQSDMELDADDTGLPVVDLNGKVVGMVIARAGRISTLILPGGEMKKLVSQEPEPLDLRPDQPVRRVERNRGRASSEEREELLRRLRELLEE